MLVGEVPREVILELGLQVLGRSLGLGLKHNLLCASPATGPMVPAVRSSCGVHIPAFSLATLCQEGCFDCVPPHLVQCLHHGSHSTTFT